MFYNQTGITACLYFYRFLTIFFLLGGRGLWKFFEQIYRNTNRDRLNAKNRMNTLFFLFFFVTSSCKIKFLGKNDFLTKHTKIKLKQKFFSFIFDRLWHSILFLDGTNVNLELNKLKKHIFQFLEVASFATSRLEFSK